MTGNRTRHVASRAGALFLGLHPAVALAQDTPDFGRIIEFIRWGGVAASSGWAARAASMVRSRSAAFSGSRSQTTRPMAMASSITWRTCGSRSV